jgi:K+ transporter
MSGWAGAGFVVVIGALIACVVIVSWLREWRKLSAVVEANEPAIEEMINARRQKQAILAV